MKPLRLYASGLFSKWGFGDGDCLGDWWWDTFDEPLPDHIDEHEVLADLVELLLVPAMEAAGHTVATSRIGTIHNPIRADIIDGEPIDHYDGDGPGWAHDIWVDIAPEKAKQLVATNQEDQP